MIKPQFNNVLIEQQKEERRTESGIYLDTVEDKSAVFKAVIIKLGPDANVCFSEGNTVILSRYQRGTEINYGGKNYNIVPDKDILATIEG